MLRYNFFLLILFCLAWIALFQPVPESVEIKNLPQQTQSIFQGWLCVNEKYNSYLYYHLFLADKNKVPDPSTAPLLLFLEGGPGDSSMQTVWADFGPYGINSNLNFSGPNDPSKIKFSYFKRNVTWSGSYNLLAIDSPVMTGFSFSKRPVNTTMDAGADLVAFLTRFYQIYENMRKTPLFIIGHSYGGHWAPYLTYTLVKDYNLTLGTTRVNLGGLILLNPFVSPSKQIGYGNYLFSAGLVDSNKRDFIRNFDIKVGQSLKAKKVPEAISYFQQELGYITSSIPGQPFITPNATIDNVRRVHLLNNNDSDELAKHYLSPKYFFNTTVEGVNSAKKEWNIPANVTFRSGEVEKNFIESGDYVADFSYTVEYLLNQKVSVTILAAQDDGVINVPGVTKLVSSLKWANADYWKTGLRQPWYLSPGNCVGIYKHRSSLNLNYVILYKSGHVSTFDQPEAVLDFISRVVNHYWP